MLDTVKFHLSGLFKESIPAGWSDTINRSLKDGRPDNYRFLVHEESGVRVSGSPEVVTFCEASLPRALHGNNGILLRDQGQIHSSVGRVLDIASQVVRDPSEGAMTRLDCVWQYRGNPSAWVVGLGSARHPDIRKEPRVFFGQSVEWVGSMQVLRIYDKLLEQTGKPGGDVVRVEAQFRGKVVKEWGRLAFGSRVVSEVDWGGCWRAYRETVGALPAFKVWEPDKMTLMDFVAFVGAQRFQWMGEDFGGKRMVDFLLSKKSRAQQYRIRRHIASAMRDGLVSMSAADILPPDGPPEVVDCVA